MTGCARHEDLRLASQVAVDEGRCPSRFLEYFTADDLEHGI